MLRITNKHDKTLTNYIKKKKKKHIKFPAFGALCVEFLTEVLRFVVAFFSISCSLREVGCVPVHQESTCSIFVVGEK